MRHNPSNCHAQALIVVVERLVEYITTVLQREQSASERKVLVLYWARARDMGREQANRLAVLTVNTSKSFSVNPEIVCVVPSGGLSYIFCVTRLTIIYSSVDSSQLVCPGEKSGNSGHFLQLQSGTGSSTIQIVQLCHLFQTSSRSL